MLKEITDSFLAVVALVAFIILTVYLATQDTTMVGPI
jgi:preprotein translocase subunit SecE